PGPASRIICPVSQRDAQRRRVSALKFKPSGLQG
ncbi:unnamed protein product, partial [marine sediment metagenome]